MIWGSGGRGFRTAAAASGGDGGSTEDLSRILNVVVVLMVWTGESAENKDSCQHNQTNLNVMKLEYS
jgi:hypothetical protein